MTTLQIGRRLGPYTRPPRGTPEGYTTRVNANGIIEWVAPGALQVRTDYAIAIALATAGAWETGSLTTAVKAGCLFKIAADQSCGVRLYRDADARDADVALGRIPPALPDPGSGVLAESWLSGANDRTQKQSPAATLFNADEPAVATLYWAVMNTMGADLPITVTLTILPLE